MPGVARMIAPFAVECARAAWHDQRHRVRRGGNREQEIGGRDPPLAHIQLERYDAAVEWCERAIRKDASQYWPHLWNAAALANLGREAEAAKALQRAKDRKPNLSLALLRRRTDWASNDNPVMNGLAKLGLIE